MDSSEPKRWGTLLGTLAEMSDLERQVVVQIEDPVSFVPDNLLEQWYSVFRGGQGLHRIGISDEILEILLEFDYGLDQVIDILPNDASDKVIFLRSDTVWQAIREMAEWTLDRIVEETTPERVNFALN